MNQTYLTYLSERIILGNSLTTRLTSWAIFLIILIFMRWFKNRCLQWLHKYSRNTETTFDDFLIKSFKALPYSFFIVIAIYCGSLFLTLPHILEQCIYVAFVILVISQIGITIWRVLLHLLQNHYFEWENWKHTVSFLRMIVNVVVWIIVILMILNNLWVEITPLITSLWIAWVAVAFALKNILEDLFSSVSLFVDKPFIIGDYIEIGEFSWSVTSIWIKTTRITTTRWEELVVSNRKLTNETVRNYWKMDHRTITEKFIVPYPNDLSILEKIPKQIHDIFTPLESNGINLVRVYLTSLEEKWVQYTYRYTIDSKDYTLYLNTQQWVHLSILEILQSHKTTIATPITRIIQQ